MEIGRNREIKGALEGRMISYGHDGDPREGGRRAFRDLEVVRRRLGVGMGFNI